MLILVAVLGIAFGHRAIGECVMARISFATSGMQVTHPAGASLFRIRTRPVSGRWSILPGSGLLMLVASVGIIELRSQTVPLTKSSVGAEFYLKRGEDFAGVHQYDLAIADYTTAIELKPDYAEAYNDRAFAYYLKGDFDRAITDYTRAIELRPNYPKAYNSRELSIWLVAMEKRNRSPTSIAPSS